MDEGEPLADNSSVMSPKKVFAKHNGPKATRPHMPGYGISKIKQACCHGSGLWTRLAKTKQYWIATTRPDGSPHVMVVWGLWLEDAVLVQYRAQIAQGT